MSYLSSNKTKDDLRSILDDIPDIGEARKKKLLKHFGSSTQVKNATLDELQKVPRIGKELAKKIFTALRKTNK